MRKNLILLTNGFPFGKGEEFLENEIPYLIKRFNQVVILTDNDGEQTRKVPESVKVYQVKKRKYSLRFFMNVFSLKTLYELLYIMKNKIKFDRYTLRLMLIYLSDATSKLTEINKITQELNLNPEDTVIYSYWTNQNALSGVLLKCKNNKYKVISRAHRYDLVTENAKNNYIPFRKLINTKIDHIFFISEQGKKYFEQKYQIKNNTKLKVARLGIDNDYFPELANKNSTDNILNIVSCSFMVPVKRIELIIKELASINHININWYHIGDGPLRGKLEELAFKSLNNKDNISYKFLGHMQNAEVYRFYSNNQVDLFINTSSVEGIPVSFMEAFSFAIPVIATDVGGVKEIVNNKNGYKLPANFTDGSLVKVLEEYYHKSTVEKQSYKEAAYKTWKNIYQARINYSNFAEFICDDENLTSMEF